VAARTPVAPEPEVEPDAPAAITSIDKLRQVFQVFDQDNSGQISAEELRKILKRYMHKDLDEEQIHDMIDRADKDGDGQVNYEEFVRIIEGGFAVPAPAPAPYNPVPGTPAPVVGTPAPVVGTPVAAMVTPMAPGAPPASPQTAMVGEDMAPPVRAVVTTSDVSGAGTDARVFIQIFGTGGGETERIDLPNSSTKFERACVDAFPIDYESSGLGRVRGPPLRIRIGHDGSGEGASWHAAQAVVSDASGARWTFRVERWFDKRAPPDGALEAEFYVTPTAAPVAATPINTGPVCHYIIQPLVELYGGCMVVLKVS
jgi:hypothetical protein